MKTLVLRIEYDGASYAGWQRQPNAMTVQEAVETALMRISGDKLNAIAAGRTDSGVHARGQVTHTYLNKEFPVREEKIRKAMNANLPRDIRINGAAIINRKFNARFDASAREYSYSIITRDSVFLNHFATYYKFPINPELMNGAAELFVGSHDFTSFSKFNAETKHYVCNVDICRWERVEPIMWRLTIRADRFVYGMVRGVTGAMLDFARGKRSIGSIRRALDNPSREGQSPLAPPEGLTLEKIFYPPDLDLFK
ncbi:MAG: tRNA pseudouridine(38-40) synthase TruA [Candidatus Kapaibacterium sp.]